MSNPEFVVAQFEIGEDYKGLARAASYVATQVSTGKASKIVASTVYTRASGPRSSSFCLEPTPSQVVVRSAPC